MNKNKAIFLDRDGTINIEKDYLHRIEDLEFEPGALDALKILKDLGYLLIVITNQSGIGRGYYTVEDMNKLNQHIAKLSEENGAKIEKFYYCPHTPNEPCDCRKPSPWMILEGAKEFNVDLKSSYMVGDKISDAEAGEKAGAYGIMLRTGHGKEEENKNTDKKYMTFDNLIKFAEYLKENNKK